MTESRPMTIEASTMTMPTERSIPAVRMISVWAIPKMPMIVTCRRIVERFEPVVKARPIDRRAQDHAEEQHEERNHGRIGVQEPLDPGAERLLVVGESHRGRGARGDTLLELGRPLKLRHDRPRCLKHPGAPAAGPCQPRRPPESERFADGESALSSLKWRTPD